MPEPRKIIRKVSMTISGSVESGGFSDLLELLPGPEGTGYSAQISAPVAGLQVFAIDLRGVSVETARDFLEALSNA